MTATHRHLSRPAQIVLWVIEDGHLIAWQERTDDDVGPNQVSFQQ